MKEGVLETSRGRLEYYIQPRAKRVILKKKNDQWKLVVPPGIKPEKAWKLILPQLSSDFLFLEPNTLELDRELFHFTNGFIIGKVDGQPQVLGKKASFPSSASIETYVHEFGKLWCTQYVAPLVHRLVRQNNLPITGLHFRKQSTRWGSCTHRNGINLNTLSVFLPTELLHYLICHELVHTKHKNHGPDFWKALESILPGSKLLDAQLKRMTPHWTNFLIEPS